jgi:hypothetical protein
MQDSAILAAFGKGTFARGVVRTCECSDALSFAESDNVRPSVLSFKVNTEIKCIAI